MRSTVRISLGLWLLLLVTGIASGRPGPGEAPAAMLGPNDQTVLFSADPVTPPRVVLTHHDGSFENAYCFQMAGVAPPSYGAFGEAFAGRPHIRSIEELVIWVTGNGSGTNVPLDIYLWEGGIGGPPGIVLHLLTNRTLGNVPLWPAVGENRLDVDVPLPEGPFTCGYWADFSASLCGWFLAGDRNGPGGDPWVNVAPGLGFATGWQHPEAIWPAPVQAFGLGLNVVLVDTGVPEVDPSPLVVPASWGAIRRLMQ